MKEQNLYKNINQINYLSTDRILSLLKTDLNCLKHYITNIEEYTNLEMLELIGELELIHHVLKLRNIGVIPNVKK